MPPGVTAATTSCDELSSMVSMGVPETEKLRSEHTGVLHTLATQACVPAQEPQLGTVRGVPQLSLSVTDSQLLSRRAQNPVSDSGTQGMELVDEAPPAPAAPPLLAVVLTVLLLEAEPPVPAKVRLFGAQPTMVSTVIPTVAARVLARRSIP